ncbi:MAG: hypothetical protein HYW49_09255 [Deltaproteobacteria bacterium]|nr:hypothetical protein [Deltaproteobacteria bacterium]
MGHFIKRKLSDFWASCKRLPQTLREVQARVRERLPKNLDDLKKLQPEELLHAVFGDDYTRLRETFTGKAYGTYLRATLVTFAAYFLADTVSLFTDNLIPEPPTVPPPKIVKKAEKTRTFEQYSAILTRNIFNSKGLIPEEQEFASGPPRKTTLPLNLIGTVVLADELKSIAAIEDKGQNMVFPVRVDDSIDGKIKITKIEHLRVYFVNQSTGHNEYVEIVDEFPKLNVTPAAPSAGGGSQKKTMGGVTQLDDSHYEVERTTIDKSLTNMGEVLQQARAIPNFENGMQNGYRLIQIVPGSIYDLLGLKNNDVVYSVDGEPLNDPGKAFQLFNQLRTIQHLELGVNRGGAKSVKNYDVR